MEGVEPCDGRPLASKDECLVLQTRRRDAGGVLQGLGWGGVVLQSRGDTWLSPQVVFSSPLTRLEIVVAPRIGCFIFILVEMIGLSSKSGCLIPRQQIKTTSASKARCLIFKEKEETLLASQARCVIFSEKQETVSAFKVRCLISSENEEVMSAFRGTRGDP